MARQRFGANLGRSALGIVLIAIPMTLAAAYASAFGSATLQLEVTTFLIAVVMVVGLQIFSGNTGIMSFGQMAFVGVGAYVGSICTLDPALKQALGLSLPGFVMDAQLSLLPAALIAALAAGIVAALTSLPVLRLPGTSAVIAIFALLLISGAIFQAWTGVTRGAGGYYAVPHLTTVWVALAFAVGAVAIGRLFRDGRLGLELRATREDEVAAASVGIAVRRLRAVAWVLGAMVSSLGGVLLAHQLTAFSPPSFSLMPTFIIIAMLVVGGMLTVSGAVLGAALVTLIQQGLRGYENTSIHLGPLSLDRLTGLTQIVLVVLILGALYMRPEGLTGRREFDEHLARVPGRLRGRRRPVTHDTDSPVPDSVREESFGP
jgi:branched-chain amino acid transport system ATP-binding protein/branched-chain amino acid transport system permease protein